MTELPRVLLVDHDGWFYGRPRFALEVAVALSEAGAEVALVGPVDEFQERVRAAGIPCYPLGEGWSQLDRSLGRQVQLEALTRRFAPDLIHAHGISEAIVSSRLGRRLGIPVVPCFHTVAWRAWRRSPGFAPRLRRFLYELVYLELLDRFTSRRCPVVQAVSGAVRANLLEVGYAPEQVRVVTMGLPLPAPPGEERGEAPGLEGLVGPRLLFLGRVSAEKGVPTLLRAAEALVAEGREFSLVLAGSGELPETSLGPDRVRTLGFREDVPALLRAVDGFVLPSQGEGLPLSLLESMAAGLPVVATRVGGIPEAVEEGASGYLCEADSSQDLTRALSRLLGEGREGMRRMGLRGREIAETRFSRRVMTENLLELFEAARVAGTA